MNKKITTQPLLPTKNKKIKSIFNRIKYYENININACKKIPDPFYIPTPKQYVDIIQFKYRIKELRNIAKHYKQPTSKKKGELQVILYNHLRLSYFIIKVQKYIRGKFVRTLNKLRGPGYFNRQLCNNPSDFYTLENIEDIENSQFISFKDEDDFIYGFDILSLYTYINKNKGNIFNPYNRSKFTEKNNPMDSIKKIINLCKIMEIKTNIIIPKQTISFQKQIELRALSIFQEIDYLGNYTDYAWLLNLNTTQQINFIHELYDIWLYRAQIDYNTKISICPPLGNPFSNIDIHHVNNYLSINNLKTISLTIIEKLVRPGVNNEFKKIGCLYVLTALTLVSSEAAAALPWLYQSVVY
jgi:hypothetical protein